jgi:hypothetical protein
MIGAWAARRAWRWYKRHYNRQYVTATIAVLPWLR